MPGKNKNNNNSNQKSGWGQSYSEETGRSSQESPEKSKSPGIVIRWNSLDGLFSIIFLIVILIGVYFGSLKFLGILNSKQMINLNISSISNLSFSIFYGIQVFLMLGVVWFFVIYWRRSNLRDLGFKYYSILKTIWYALISIIFIFLMSFLYVLALKSIFGIEAPPSKVEELINNRNISSNILIIITSIIAPFCEEIYFRGFLYSAFKKNFGVTIALFLSSFLFALAHLEIYSFIPILIIGWLLAYVFEKTKSIFTSMFIHAVYNLILISILLGKIQLVKLY